MASHHTKTITWIRRGEVLGVTIKKVASELGSLRWRLAEIGRSIGEFFHYPRLRT